MRPTGKITCLFFLFLIILLSPLYSQPLREQELSPNDEDSFLIPQQSLEGEDSSFEPQPNPRNEDSLFNNNTSPDKELLFFEELFVFDNIFSFFETLMNEDTSSDEASLLAKENPSEKAALLEKISTPEEDALLAKIISPDEDTLPNEDVPFATADLPAKEGLPDEDSLSEETIPVESTLLTEEDDDYIDDEALFFEAIPMIVEVPTFEMRSFDAIFSNLSPGERAIAMSEDGLRHSFAKEEAPTYLPNPDFGIDLFSSIIKKNPSHLIEAVVVVPYNKRELDLLDVYNAIGRIEKIKDQTIPFGGKETNIFSESTRIDNARSRKAIPDPLPAVSLPFSETMYLRLKEIFLGNLFLRGELSISIYGITYSMTNFIDVRYFLIPIMKAERFITIIYLEPVKEGVLIYSMTGFYLPGFIADRIRLTPNINRRIKIFVDWITDGLRKQEKESAQR